MINLKRSTKINRSAVVRDSRVEDEYKTLVENNRKHSEEPRSLRPRAASEKSRAEEDEIKVVSYKDVKPKCEDRGYVRIIRSVGSDGEEVSDKLGKRWTSDTADKPAKVVKKVVEKERIVRKVYAVEKNVDGVSNTDSMLLSTSVCLAFFVSDCLSSIVSCCCRSSGLSLFADVVGRCSALSLFGV